MGEGRVVPTLAGYCKTNPGNNTNNALTTMVASLTIKSFITTNQRRDVQTSTSITGGNAINLKHPTNKQLIDEYKIPKASTTF